MDQQHDDEKTYTEAEIEHILARRMAKVQMDQLTDRVIRNEAKNSEIFSDIRTSLKSLTDSIAYNSQAQNQSRKELWEEIESKFVSEKYFRLEMDRVETMIRVQWQKITLAVTVAVVMVQAAFKFL